MSGAEPEKEGRTLRSLSRIVAAAVAAAAVLITGWPVVPTVAASASTAAQQAAGGSPGYWLIGRNGQIFQFGTTNYGDLRSTTLAKPIVGGTATRDGLGYWMVATDGGIFAYGDAGFHGSTGNLKLNKPIVGMAADPANGGYWMVASDGGIFAFGASFFGSMGGKPLTKPIVGIVPTPTGQGYWMVASDGGIFAFGDAGFYGSTGNIRLNKPIVGMASSSDGRGYWMVASDGGIFTFGDAAYYGSTGNLKLNRPVVGMAASQDGRGYWMVASDGGIFTFGDAAYLGSAQTGGDPPVVAMTSTSSGFPFPPGGTGYDVSQYQCTDYVHHVSGLPPAHPQVAIVQVSGGAINRSQPPTCYPAEAAWAGQNMSVYIFMNPLPSPAPPESLTGPAGTCAAGDTNCEGYNFGYSWAQHWVQYAHDDNTHPTLWWLDVETGGGWDQSPAGQQINSRVIAGAVAGLRAASVTPGIYATHLQWGEITGNGVSFPHIPLWIPGAAGTAQAQQFCTNPGPFYAPFAGGVTVLVQDSYTNPQPTWDEDYACK
jgi:hypothetical protein